MNISTLYTKFNVKYISKMLKNEDNKALSKDTNQNPELIFKQDKKISKAAESQIDEHNENGGGKELFNHETTLTGKDGLIRPNTDIGLIQKVHPPYIHYLDQISKNTIEIEEVDNRSLPALGAKAKKKEHAEPKNFTTKKIGKEELNIGGKTGGASTIKVIALSKAAHMKIIFSHDESPYTVCFGKGHWVQLKDIQGDHAYPGSFVIGRLYQFFSDENTIGKKGNQKAVDPREELDPIMKYTPSKPKNASPQNVPTKAMFMMYYSDAKNLIGLCETCNKSKGENFITSLVSSRYYGNNFINAHFPLNYSTIIPRTKDGQGLGDAMMMFFFNTHAIKEALNLFNSTAPNPDDDIIDGTDVTKGKAKEAIRVFKDLGVKLTKEQKAQLAELEL